MAKEMCPGCGAPYNGRKCRACFFQPVQTDISRGGRKDSTGSALPGRNRRQYSAARSLMGFLVILLLIALLLPTIRTLGERLEQIEASHSISGNP